MYAQLYKLVPKDVVEVPKGDISQSTSKQIPCNHTSVVNKPLVLSLNASNETEDLPEGEKEALLLLDRALADHSGGSISSEEVFEESDKNSGSSGSPYLRSKPRSSPRCGVSSLIETKSKDFPFNFIRNRENKLVRSQSDSEPVCHSSAVKPFNSYVKVLSKATDL
ncbi:hypothetical protein QYM36_015600 [Artemia franciscana]|uniref:Uncharacterized protein n=2 Tax=Artemia franciscana TaxID=6661 RepID=A0AA88HLZ8_ARTSF|nr:hypothetical protein QYM36_015600 [Artemia franciscana]